MKTSTKLTKEELAGLETSQESDGSHILHLQQYFPNMIWRTVKLYVALKADFGRIP